jgi:hypothetical protein
MPVHVLMPIVVVDELDGLKKSKGKDTRWRVACTLAVLDRVLATSGGAAMAGTVIPADQGGGCTVEIVFDPPAHIRLPINDDELYRPDPRHPAAHRPPDHPADLRHRPVRPRPSRRAVCQEARQN